MLKSSQSLCQTWATDFHWFSCFYAKERLFKNPTKFITNQNDVLAQIRAVGENYPELLSSNQFLALQKEIADENEDLAAAKRIVNSNVSHINQEIVSFPASIVAGVKGIHQVPFLAEETQGKKDLSDLNYDLN